MQGAQSSKGERRQARNAARRPRPPNGPHDELATVAAELDRVRRLFDVASTSARIGSWELELPSRRLIWSRELYRMHGIDPSEDISVEAALRLYPGDERKRLEAALEQAIASGGYFELEAPLITGDGEVRWMRMVSQGHSDDHLTKRLVGTIQDITEDRRRQRMLERLARQDDLTGLPNRKLFREDLEAAISNAKTEGGEVGLMLIDLDDFKTVNDTFGHDHGDQMLQEFARRLKLCFRAGDTLARLGGDEFAVVLTDWPGADGLGSIIDRIRVEMAGGFEIGGETVEAKASVGSAIFPKHAASGTELMRQADIALYAAKAAGRGVHCVYTHTMGEELALRHRTLGAIRGAIIDREIVPFYQPIVRASDLQPVGLEALVRWKRSPGQAVPPGLFMAAFADPPLATAIGEIMITAVAGQINAWREDGIAVPPVSVNVAPDQMAWPDFAPALLNLLAAYQVPPSLLAVEITEDVILSQDRHALVATMQRLSAAGIRIDFDDFGTGYASLTHLKEYPVDRIKLDRSFISQLPHERESLGIVRAVISLAHELSKEVVAEGVETREQAALLTGMGCDMMQGYLFAMPMPADEAGDYLASHTRLQVTAEATPLRAPHRRPLATPA